MSKKTLPDVSSLPLTLQQALKDRVVPEDTYQDIHSKVVRWKVKRLLGEKIKDKVTEKEGLVGRCHTLEQQRKEYIDKIPSSSPSYSLPISPLLSLYDQYYHPSDMLPLHEMKAKMEDDMYQSYVAYIDTLDLEHITPIPTYPNELLISPTMMDTVCRHLPHLYQWNHILQYCIEEHQSPTTIPTLIPHLLQQYEDHIRDTWKSLYQTHIDIHQSTPTQHIPSGESTLHVLEQEYGRLEGIMNQLSSSLDWVDLVDQQRLIWDLEVRFMQSLVHAIHDHLSSITTTLSTSPQFPLARSLIPPCDILLSLIQTNKEGSTVSSSLDIWMNRFNAYRKGMSKIDHMDDIVHTYDQMKVAWKEMSEIYSKEGRELAHYEYDILSQFIAEYHPQVEQVHQSLTHTMQELQFIETMIHRGST